jgi:hypothetical protein
MPLLRNLPVAPGTHARPIAAPAFPRGLAAGTVAEVTRRA